MSIKVKCKYDKMIPIGEVLPNPRNPNQHPDIQIKGLQETHKDNEIRHPLIISNQSGLLVAGHARLEVMKKMKMKKVPVTYQDFANEEKEFQFMVADNESQRKSWLDPEKFQIATEELKITDIKLESFGIYDSFPIDSKQNENQEDDEASSKDQSSKEVTCPECNHSFYV